jgi:hypothetical protein
MNKMLHAVVLVFFGSACWFLALMLKMPTMVARSSGALMPPFARLCVSCGPLLMAGLVFSAVAYCIYVWTRKDDNRASWVAFLATSASVLLVVLMPAVVALFITVADFINRSSVH